jgi:Man1-Src1p-C-terminal domain
MGNGRGAKSAEVSEHDLKQTVAKKRRRGMSDAEFDDLWNGAIGEIVARDEVVSESRG